ncbi:ROK family protein [Niallia circulans]|uniref:ROK family protein n=1 Tax=Niallia circulans TaxID=1397 RepID=UPI000F4489CE|nr:ROK family protein [Niallia circulans]AYV66121.1 ROK family protein [Niallia circulans]
MYLVIDIGGTYSKYALLNSAGEIIRKNKRLTIKTNLDDFKEALFSIIEEHDLTNIKGIAISCPGTVDVNSGVIYYGGSFPFLHEVNLARMIESKYDIETTVENDGKCAALAELWLGSIKGKKDAVVLVLGSGVGGGIVLDGKLHRGVNLSAGEISYVMSSLNPITRETSFMGALGSSALMVRRVAEVKQLGDVTDGEAVFNFINQGDGDAIAIFEEFCMHIAGQILNLQYILDPEIFAIGGGVSVQPILLERIKWAVEEIKQANPMHMAKPNIVACHFRNDANLYGALYHFFVSKEREFIS